ncbi:MAG TPA: hypothetical protein VNQ76_07830, partial [Planctomicrobium sp.]|nr:hypothetical protein [Planctomicrobium sp.]
MSYRVPVQQAFQLMKRCPLYGGTVNTSCEFAIARIIPEMASPCSQAQVWEPSRHEAPLRHSRQ